MVMPKAFGGRYDMQKAVVIQSVHKYFAPALDSHHNEMGRNISTANIETADCTLLRNRNVRGLVRINHSPYKSSG